MLSQIAEYLEWKKTSKTRAGESYKRVLLRLDSYVKDKKIEFVTKEDLLGFIKYLQEELPRVSVKGDWHTNYWYHLTVLKNFLRFWREEGLCHVRPDIIQVPKVRLRPYHAVSLEEFEMMDTYLETEPENFASLQQRLIINFLWNTGIRVSELVALNWNQFTHDNCILIENRKNGRSRWIFWSTQTHLLLLLFIAKRKQYRGDWLFATYEGRMSVRAVQRFLKNLGKKMGITYHLSPHCFRHGWSHYRLSRGADIKVIKDGLGHTTFESTDRYLALNREEQEKRARKYLT